MYDYQIGGNAVKTDASEGMAEIPMNRSLFVQKLTAEDPVKPEAVYDLNTVDEVFDFFRPAVSVAFERQDGAPVEESIRFRTLADFRATAITAGSPFLQALHSRKAEYQKLMKQLKTNKQIRTVIENPETRAAFTAALQALIAELDAGD